MNVKGTAVVFAAVALGGLSSAYGVGMGTQQLAAQAEMRGASPVSRHAALFGSPAPQSYATRTVAVVPGMRYVNVDSGETVAFRSGGKLAAWTFTESISGTSVDLGMLMPDMPGATGVRVYIERSKLFTGG
ncbi:CzcE family metal-binding protein [Cupriavidus oxalaticus]|uniref:CzcE family metal-binding protein n=1 Tax=Cupriavidus oxalaticus TaxID=96344 RepID=UPI0040342922